MNQSQGCVKQRSHNTAVKKTPHYASFSFFNDVPVCDFNSMPVFRNQVLYSDEIFDKFQSHFRVRHCTETALHKVSNDILMPIVGECSFLMLIDISAAFDTADHSIVIVVGFGNGRV